MKKIAIKGLTTLFAVVALCMFFSGTVKSLSTAKVKLVTAKSGKLEEQVKLSGTLYFPETEEIGLSGLAQGQSVVMKRVRVTAGRRVSTGDVLFEAEVTDYEHTMQTLQQEYDDAQAELLELERKNGELRLKRTEEMWVEAYDALLAAGRAVQQARTALCVAAAQAAVPLDGDALPDDVQDETLLLAAQALSDARAAQNTAQTRFTSANRLGISDSVVTYVTKERELMSKMETAQEKISALAVLSAACAQVVALHDGYVVSVAVKAGDSYEGKTAALVMSAAGTSGVLRADVSSIERTIDKGTAVEIARNNGSTIKKKTTDTGIDAEGKKTVDVALTDKDITNLGGAAALMATPKEMVASYRASSATTLLPVSAVRGTGDNRYVYVVNESESALGARVLKVSRQNVEVLAEVGSTASLKTDLSRQRIAYMEDRALEEGSEVMTYAQ